MEDNKDKDVIMVEGVEDVAPQDNEFIQYEEEHKDEMIEITEENLKEFADQLQFDSLAQEVIAEDLCKSYNITKEDLFVLIHELKKRGNNVVTLNTTAYKGNNEEDAEKVQVTLIRNFGHEKLIDDLSYEIVDNEENTKIMLISDTRLGSIYEQITILNDLYLKAKQMGVKYVFLTGDVVEGVYSGIKSILNTTLHRYGYEDQAEYVAQMFPRVDGITTYFVTGEHDLSFLKTKEKVDIGTLIASKREDMVYLGPRRRKVTFVTDDKRNGSVSLYLQHATGQVPYTVSYKPQQKISSMRNEDKTDILVTSHFAACDSFLRRGVRSYQVPTVVATTDEMKDASTPVYNTIGAWLVSLDKDKKGNLKNTTQMWIPYYNTIVDDYKTAKSLYLNDDNKKIFIPHQVLRDEKDRIFAQIKNGEDLSEVLTRLNMSELKFGGLLEEFLLRGYSISLNEKDGKTIISKKRNKSSSKGIKPELDELTKISETWISDSHLCNEAQQLNMINQIYQETYERGITTVRHFGDISDGDYTNRSEHRYELFRLGASRQIEYIVNYWPMIDGITTEFIVGNHDITHERNGGVFIGPIIESLRPDLKFVGSEHAYVFPEESPKTTIEMFHPGGGCASSLSYRPQKYIEKMEPGSKPNIVGMGHYHQSEFISYRNVLGILLPCLTSKSNFAIRQGLENTMGAYFITMYVNQKGEIEMFEFEEKRFTQKDVKKDDFLKTKQLVLKR